MFKKRSPASSTRPGFTLFELMITIFLIVGALFPILSFINTALLTSGGTESETIALNLARAKMEEIKSVSFNLITSEARAAFPGKPKYQREVIVSLPLPSLKDVKVFVYWTPSGGEEEFISFESYVSNF
jgi:Tfp pilus assembly protein PilV